MKHSILFTALLSAIVVVPAAAQERGVARRMFTFLDNQVTVEVHADMPGTLQIVRGEEGVIDVAGRVPGGMSSFALGGREGNSLRLTAVGGDKADFIVVVPEDAYVRVRLPNRKKGEVGSTRPGKFQWGETSSADGKSATAVTLPPTGPVIAHSSQTAPRVVNVPRLNAVRSISLRFEPGSFQVGGTRYMSVANGSSQNIEIRTGDEIEDLIVSVPLDTRDFTLKLAGRTALIVRGYEITAYCEPMMETQLEAGRRWFNFAPQMGRMSCR